MKIGELARVAQCTVETVRYYEKEGLLPEPTRTVANYRSYGSAHVRLLRFIRNCRALDMTQEEIRALLGLMNRVSDDCGAVSQLLDEHIAHVDVRISELLHLKQHLRDLRQKCQSEKGMNSCGILQGLTSMDTKPRHERHTHIA
jgi:Cd(II)/Pb(II)-responsive transcriptional regulator